MAHEAHTIRIPAQFVRVGDEVHFLGRSHIIVDTSETNGWGDPVARAADGWGITIQPGIDLTITKRIDR